MKIFKFWDKKERPLAAKWFENAAAADAGVEEVVAAIGGLVRQDGDIALQKLRMLSDPKISRVVRQEGAKALLKFYRQAKVSGDAMSLKLSPRELERAWEKLPGDIKKALKKAQENIQAFHEKQLRGSWQKRTQKDGRETLLGQIFNPISVAGIYVPGGKAPLVSTVMMLAIPAGVAGVKRKALCTPAGPDGTINTYVLAAAYLCGIEEVYAVGGSQAIFAMDCGTATIPKVDKIAGPGNAFVIAALRQVQAQGRTGIDSIPGPSEVMIVADESADPVAVAADLCSQAEHDEQAMAVLVSLSPKFTAEVLKELKTMSGELTEKGVSLTALEKRGAVLEVKDMEQAVQAVDLMAPEHLEIILRDQAAAENMAFSIKHAGAILIGPHSPVALSDYFAGPSHVLPTGGTARFASGVTVDTFLKKSSLISYNAKALEEAAPFVETLAKLEGLTAHALSVQVRVGKKS